MTQNINKTSKDPTTQKGNNFVFRKTLQTMDGPQPHILVVHKEMPLLSPQALVHAKSADFTTL